MDPFAAFALTFGMIAAASHQAAVMEDYARARHAPMVVAQPAWEPAPLAYYVPVASVPPPVPGWAAGAAVGAQVGALASAANPVLRCGGRACGVGFDPAPVLAGAVIGGLIGHAASTPPVVAAVPPSPPPAAPRRSSADSREFTRHWQEFMQPAVPRSAEHPASRTGGWGR